MYNKHRTKNLLDTIKFIGVEKCPPSLPPTVDSTNGNIEKSFTHFISLLSPDLYSPVYLDAGDNAKVSNSL